ncbi:hypothetical protein BaRGS_00005762, partial [Batillaria attramentaria]
EKRFRGENRWEERHRDTNYKTTAAMRTAGSSEGQDVWEIAVREGKSGHKDVLLCGGRLLASDVVPSTPPTLAAPPFIILPLLVCVYHHHDLHHREAKTH